MLCFSPIVNHNDKNLVQGCGQFKVFEEFSSLQFVVHCTSPYICKSCVSKLWKQQGLHDNLKKIDEDLFNDYISKAFKAGLTVKKKFQESVDSSPSPEKRILLSRRIGFLFTKLRHSHLLPRKPLVLSQQFPFLPLDR